MGKKSKVQDDELEENEEGTDPSHQSDATGFTNVSSDFGKNKKLFSQVDSEKKSRSKSKNEDENEDSAALRKKKNSKVIQFVIIGALIIFVGSDYILPPEEPVKAVAKRPKQEKVKTPVENSADVSKTETAKDEVDATVETKIETGDDSNVDVTSKEVPIVETTTEATPALETTTEATPALETTTEATPALATTTESTPVIETTAGPTPVIETTAEPTPAIETTTEATPALATTTEPTPAIETTSDITLNDNLSPEPMDDVKETPVQNDTGIGESTTSDEENLTDQILQDLEKQAKATPAPVQIKQYVSPPDYEYRGRGLVYNCSGKHWACVDAPSYRTCEENASSVNYLKKNIECYPFNVYETPRGCENVQNRMVSSSAKTKFCNE